MTVSSALRVGARPRHGQSPRERVSPSERLSRRERLGLREREALSLRERERLSPRHAMAGDGVASRPVQRANCQPASETKAEQPISKTRVGPDDE